MGAVKIPARSRLQFANLAQVADQTGTQITFWDIPRWPNDASPAMAPQPDDVKYQWDQLDRIESLADRFYGDHRLWWVIALRNQLFDLPSDVKTGDVIIIPSQRYVLNVFFAKAK